MVELILLGWMLLASGFFTGLLFKSAVVPHLRTKTVASVKVHTPLDNPWGTTADLIAWAEQRAVREHREAYRDPVTEELEKHFLAEFRKGGVTVLEDYDFRTPNERREAAGYIKMSNGQYGRYLDDIGYVTADSPELLNRACRVVLDGHSDRYAAQTLLWEMYEAWEPADRQHCVWVMSDLWFTRVRNMLGPGDHPLWTPSMTIDGPMHLMGLPLDIRADGGEPHLELKEIA